MGEVNLYNCRASAQLEPNIYIQEALISIWADGCDLACLISTTFIQFWCRIAKNASRDLALSVLEVHIITNINLTFTGINESTRLLQYVCTCSLVHFSDVTSKDYLDAPSLEHYLNIVNRVVCLRLKKWQIIYSMTKKSSKVSHEES